MKLFKNLVCIYTYIYSKYLSSTATHSSHWRCMKYFVVYSIFCLLPIHMGQQVNTMLYQFSYWLATGNEVSHLKSSCLQQHDLIMLAQGLKPRDALGKFDHFFDSWSEALRESLPYLLTGGTGWGNWAGIERTCLQRDRKTTFNYFNKSITVTYCIANHTLS